MTQNFEKIMNDHNDIELSSWLEALAINMRERPDDVINGLDDVADFLLAVVDKVVGFEIKAERYDAAIASAKEAVEFNKNIVAFKPSERMAQIRAEVVGKNPDDGGRAA